ncbi:Rrf2 family transcriptional regulator [candidate division KSB1 bacterium]|nr:Rrf2 family transcriptional regulator [candidate division KSB1 bacterium]
MKLSTRSRYGTRLMFELALNYGQGTIFLKDVSKRQNISEKYLSNIIIPLKGAGLVSSVRGAYGGYMLTKAPGQITLKEIVLLLEGDLAVDSQENTDTSAHINVIDNVWVRMQTAIYEFLEGVTLHDLLDEYRDKNESESGMYFI